MKGKIEVENIRFFKNDWGIVDASVIETTEGQFELNFKKQITIKGNMPEVEVGRIYYLTANKIVDPKWGLQYEVVSLASELYVDDSSEAGKRKYLQVLFTERTVDNMYAALPDPFKALKEKDYEALVQIKGCQIPTAVRWVEKFENEYSLSRLYVELEAYGLSTSMLKLLLRSYKSPDVVIKNVKENPYLLTEVRGIGFTKADAIAQKAGIGPYDTRRIKAFIIYYLSQQAQEGNSYVSCDTLMNELVNQMGDELPDMAVADSIHELGDQLWYDDEKINIGLMRYRQLEQSIADELWRIKNAKSVVKIPEDREQKITEIEQRQGWQFTDQQRAAINTLLDNNIVVINGAAGCVDCDTEFFTGHGWKRIADFEEGDMVLQYNEDGTAELVKPLAYIKQPCDTLYHFETKRGISQTLSDEHRVLYYIKNHDKNIERVDYFRDIKDKIVRGAFNGKIKTTFMYSGEGMPLSDDEIRLMVAIFADGRFENFALKETNPTYKRVRMNLKKPRKQKRIEWLLDKLRIDYRKTNVPTQDGYLTYYFKAPMLGKHFTKEWYSCTQEQLKVITDEVMYWDGDSVRRKSYMTSCKEDADFIQFAFSATGRRGSIAVADRRGRLYKTAGKLYKRKSIEYRVLVADNEYVGWINKENYIPSITPITPKDGYKYCFTVPSDTLVLRKDNRIFISKNSGKSALAFGVLELLKSCSYGICALSGKAAVRLGEASGRTGSTIHRLLGFTADGFTHNKENPLPQDIIVVDEISMIGGRLFLYLLQAVKNGAKLILLGDTGQLEAIGECNVANDIIKSGAIPVVTLDKIHRQGQKSAIITESMKVRSGKQLISSKEWAGQETRGEKQDFVLDCYSDSSNTYPRTLRYFDEAMQEVSGDVNKVQILCPMKSRGEASVWSFNQAIQAKYNPPCKDKDEIEVYYASRGKGILRVGDKVINVKNNYKTLNCNGKITPIFNGNIGTILSIDTSNRLIVVDFIGMDQPIVITQDLSCIELAYAVTVHKYQGSAAEIVILALDFASRVLLSKELVYTGITRASKKCIVVSQNSALRFAVSQTNVSKKNTHLLKMLQVKAHPELEKITF